MKNGTIRVGDRFINTSEEHILMCAQLGVDGGFVRLECFPGFEERGRPDPEAVRRLVRRFQELGLDPPGLELRRSHMKGFLRGLPDERKREMERIAESMRILADCGVVWTSIGFGVAHADDDASGWRGYLDEPIGRAGAVVRSFDASRLDDGDLVTWGREDPERPGIRVTREEFWRRLDPFMEGILPVARETGIRLAFHPNDPPLPVYRGVEQLLTTVDAQAELLERYDDPQLGLTFCCGTMQESGGDVVEGIRRYGRQGKLFHVHFRNVRGTVPRFQEVFQDEGDYDPVEVMRALYQVGFEGYVIADHLPGLAVDMEKPPTFLLHGMKTGTRDVAHGWSVGYLRALVQAARP